MITNKLIKITVRLYWTSLIVHWVAAAFQVTMKTSWKHFQEWQIHLPSMTTSLLLWLLFFYCSKSIEDEYLAKATQLLRKCSGVSCRHIAWSRLRDSRARGIEEARTQKREETVERRGGSRLSLSRLQFPTLLRLPHYLRAWNRRVDRRHINLLFHSTNCVSYIGTFSQQNRKSRVATLDKPFWA